MNNRHRYLGLSVLVALAISVALAGCGGTVASDSAVEAVPESSQKVIPVAKRDPNRLWCGEHNVYEDECVICHPELAEKLKEKTPDRDPNRLWCGEHNTYEDECTICHPELAEKKSDSGPTSAAGLLCKEHHVPEIECGICHPERVAGMTVGSGMKVRFTSAESTIKAGVVTALPPASSVTSRDLLGEVRFDQSKLVVLSPLTDGVIREVLKDVGDVVASGEVVATIQSAAVAEARSALQKAGAAAELARQTLKREKDLFARQISARQDLEQAEAAVSVAQSEVGEATQRLQSLGLSAEDAAKGDRQGLLSVRAPFNGTIIERTATPGTAATAGDALFRLADLSTMWMVLSVPENMLAAVQTGGHVAARFDAYPGLAFEGGVRWVSPSVDPDTRMLQARVELPNPQGLLKDGLFGRASLSGSGSAAVISVPAAAIQDVDGTTVVFRKLEDDLFEARRVEVGARDGLNATVLAGLSPDEAIVTEGSYIVKSELLKARLGAGCTDE